jgi:hypothetical protein
MVPAQTAFRVVAEPHRRHGAARPQYDLTWTTRDFGAEPWRRIPCAAFNLVTQSNESLNVPHVVRRASTSDEVSYGLPY